MGGIPTESNPESPMTAPATQLEATLYGCLSPTEFRLLQISKTNTKNIECSLTTHDINTAPNYSAISYTWGQAEEPEFMSPTVRSVDKVEPYTIVINDRPVEVNENLYDLLEEFKRSLPDGINYWIDAICINQADKDEKAHQVNHMDKIYASSLSVLIWLGRAHDNTPKVLNMIDRLGVKFKEEHDAVGDMRRIVHINDIQSEEHLAHLGLQGTSKADWLGLTAFFQRRWFFRVWTIQEAALAKEIICLVGDTMIAWPRLMDCSRLLGDTSLGNGLIDMAQRHFKRADVLLNQVLFLFMQSIASGKGHELKMDLKMRQWYGVDNVYSSVPALLFECLSNLRSSKATDARDRVYGLLGLLTKVADEYSKQPLKITADYGRSASSVFTEVMTYVLSDLDSLTLLSDVQDSTLTSDHSLPSWVVDFSQNSPTPMITRRFLADKEAYHQLDASNGVISAQKFSIEGKKLYLSSYKVGTITDVGDSAEDLADNKFEKTAAMVLASLQGNGGSSASKRIEALMKTLLTDLPIASSSSIGAAYSSFVMQIVASAVVVALRQGGTRSDCLAGMPNLGRLGCLDTSGIIPSHEAVAAQCEHFGLRETTIENVDRSVIDRAHQAMQPFYLMFMRVGVRRRPFLLDTGEFGLAAQGVKPGDLVCIVPDGVRTPLVFRTREGRGEYERMLIGEAYVSSLVRGEGVQKMMREGKTWESICVI